MPIIEKLHVLWYNTHEKVLRCKTFGKLRSHVRNLAHHVPWKTSQKCLCKQTFLLVRKYT